MDVQYNKHLVPNYQGLQWLQCQLPSKAKPWMNSRHHDVCFGKSHQSADADKAAQHPSQALHQLLQGRVWQWPKRPVMFLTDAHADGDAFWASLVASGGIQKTGPDDDDFRLTELGRRALFIIGGDCFDKGPDNLRLLRCLSRFKQRGARLRILAGNHDLRVFFGMRCVGLQGDTGNEHFFIRMGNKAIPLLKEINQEYLSGKHALRDIPSEAKCRSLLYPSADWPEQFSELAAEVISDKAIAKEIEKIAHKSERFAEKLQAEGLCMRRAYAAALVWQRLFLDPQGEFFWFFDEMRIAMRRGSFLFVHAGLDDRVIELIRDEGVHQLNQQFHQQIHGKPFDFYYRPLANTIRTKYRRLDPPLTPAGSHMAHELGIYSIVHGHLNLKHGQRISVRTDMVNFECDTTMDINSRVKEGINGFGAGVTAILPEKKVLGVSSDCDYVKVLDLG